MLSGDFSITVEAGEFTDSEIIVMLGENGTGKTTFIRMMAGRLEPEDGSKLENWKKLKKKIYVVDDYVVDDYVVDDYVVDDYVVDDYVVDDYTNLLFTFILKSDDSNCNYETNLIFLLNIIFFPFLWNNTRSIYIKFNWLIRSKQIFFFFS